MLRLTPILIAILAGLIMYMISAWRTARELDARSTLLADAAILKLTSRLARTLDIKNLSVHVYEVEQVNGLAAPDGRIFITRGFYQAYHAGKVSAAEIASVIAHELGHVALGHARRRMIDFSGQNAIRVALMMVLGRFIPGLGVFLANFLTQILSARLSRQDEYEADAWAAAVLVKSGIGVAPQISLLQKIAGLTGARGEPPLWLLSHPKTAERVAEIRRLTADWNQPTPQD